MLNAQGLKILIRLFKCTEKVCCGRKTRLGAAASRIPWGNGEWAIITVQSNWQAELTT